MLLFEIVVDYCLLVFICYGALWFGCLLVCGICVSCLVAFTCCAGVYVFVWCFVGFGICMVV